MFLQTDPNFKKLKKNGTHFYYCLTHKHSILHEDKQGPRQKTVFAFFFFLMAETLFNLFFFRMYSNFYSTG